MSPLIQTVRTKMFGFFKHLVAKMVSPSAEGPPPAACAPAPEGPPAAPSPTLPPKVTPLHKEAVHHNGKGIDLPLRSILAALPLELQPRIKTAEVGDQTLAVPLEKILAQLSHGAVKISFGELRQAAPHVFTEDNDRDRVLVPLPLAEILSRLNPVLIQRRRVQRQVEVPDEISSPFGARGQGLIFSVGPSKPELAPPPPRQTAPASPPAPPIRTSLASVPTPAPPSATSADAPAMISAARTVRELSAKPSGAPAPVPQPATPPRPSGQPAGSPPPPPGDSAPLMLALTALAEGWPEAVRKEIVQLSLVEAKVVLPSEVAERALKQGRVAFSWKTLRSWIKPAPLPTVSAQDSTVLELPLKVVAPLFLARQTEAGKLQHKVSVDENIPNLFFGFPQPEAGSSAVASPAARLADTNYYVWDDSTDRANVDETEAKRVPSPGTRFVAKYATPNEIVSRAAALDGVAGALIALPDGLMVASRLSPDLNGDTLAAFLPQIFGKVSQCTKELRMGELNNLNFTVGNVPWKIFRVNAIFFAAFGRAGSALPTARLAALAAELDHKPK